MRTGTPLVTDTLAWTGYITTSWVQQICKCLLTTCLEKQSGIQTWIVRKSCGRICFPTCGMAPKISCSMSIEKKSISAGLDWGPPRQDPNKEAGDFGDPLGLGQYNEEFRNKARSLGSPAGIPYTAERPVSCPAPKKRTNMTKFESEALLEVCTTV